MKSYVLVLSAAVLLVLTGGATRADAPGATAKGAGPAGPIAPASEAANTAAANTAGPAYTADGKLKLPENFREWIFLSSGIDMSYREGGNPMGHSMFDNVFAEPGAYREFVRTGTWPDKTTLVLEIRGAADKGSINRQGKFQNAELMGLELHVKDTKRFAGGWAFFGFEDRQPAQQIPTSAQCYSCHQQNAAVDTTFVQFYPTLLPIATAKGTLSPGYRP